MNELILAAVTCYQLGANITSCDNGETVYKLGNVYQITGQDNRQPIASDTSTQQLPILPVLPAINPPTQSFGVLKPFD